MEQQLFNLTLLVSSIVCLLMAFALFRGSRLFSVYPAYRRYRLVAATALAVFGAAFLLLRFIGIGVLWPYPLLLCLLMAVLIAVFYTLTAYGDRHDDDNGQ